MMITSRWNYHRDATTTLMYPFSECIQVEKSILSGRKFPFQYSREKASSQYDAKTVYLLTNYGWVKIKMAFLHCKD